MVRPQIFAVDCKIFEAAVNDLQLSAKNLRAGGIVKDPCGTALSASPPATARSVEKSKEWTKTDAFAYSGAHGFRGGGG
jgi:hypothetical protein